MAVVAVVAVVAAEVGVALPGSAAAPAVEPRKVAVDPLDGAPLAATTVDAPAGDFSSPPLTGVQRGEERMQAAQRAADLGSATVVGALTSPTRKVFEHSDGSRTAVISQEPVRFESGGSWRDIDLALRERADRDLEPVAAPHGVRVPSDPARGVAVDETAAGEVRFGVPSVIAGRPTLAVDPLGEAADAAVVSAGGVSSVVTATATGFEHDVVFEGPQVAVASFTVPVSLPEGVSARPSAAGVEFVDGSGPVLGTYAGGVAFDAGRGGRIGDDTPVRVALAESGPGFASLEVSVDPTWLGDPARVFPVTVDPTYTSTIGITPGGGDTYVNSGAPSTSYASSTSLLVGKGTTGDIYRSFVRFGAAGIPADVVVQQANIRLYNFESASCTASLVRARTLTGSFGPTTTWNTQPGVSSAVAGDGTWAHGATGCAAAWDTVPVAVADVQGWVSGTATNNGYRLSADESSTAGFKKFKSSASGASTAPQLVVTYDNKPPSPTQASPADGARVASLQPTLTVNPVTDPDGDAVTYWFKVWTGDGLPVSGEIADSGWISSTSWQVPDGVLADGTTYSWAVWVRGGGGWPRDPSQSRRLTIDRRVEDGASDGAGPISVNLVNGAASYATSSPAMGTLGGGIGLGYSYSSQAGRPSGLTGEYWVDANHNAAFDDGNPVLTRLDRSVSFEWSDRSPSPEIPRGEMLTRWTGFVTAPTTGTYWFGGHFVDGLKITVAGSTVLNRWPNQFAIFDPAWGTSVSLTAGVPVAVTVEFNDGAIAGGGVQLVVKTSDNGAEFPVPSAWLSPARQPDRELSAGWSLDTGGFASWDSARVGDGSITLVAPGGATTEFRRNDANNGTGGWAPVDESVTTNVSLSAAGAVTATDGATVHVFNVDGTLESVSDGDATTSTSPTYTYTTVSTGGVSYPRVTKITDPVSGRDVLLRWSLPGTTCPTAPAGFDATYPVGALCKAEYWDGTATTYAYKASLLARITDPAAAVTDFAYDASGRLWKVRDPLAYDAIAWGQRADDDTAVTLVTYESPAPAGGAHLAKVTSIQLPAPTAGATRPQTTFGYTAGQAWVDVAGAVPAGGHTRTVGFDAAGRVTTETDAGGRTTTTEWSATVDDQVLSTTDPAGLKSTIIYDDDGTPTDFYGPAPTSCFLASRLPDTQTCPDVPHDHVDLDEATQGLTATWFDNDALSGEPADTDLGLGDPTGAVTATWTSPPTGLGQPFSLRLTGQITFPTVGTYGLTLDKTGYGRLRIDGATAVDGWTTTGDATGTFTTTTAGETHDITIEFISPTSGTSALGLQWTPPGGSLVTVPGTALAPNLDNPTGIASDAGSVDVSYTGGGVTPDDQAPTAVTEDPGGSALTTSFTYEPEGTGRGRTLTRTLPAANTWSYAYYGDTETADNPCTTGTTEAINQAGQLRNRTGPANSNGVARTDTFVYDEVGRVLASKVGTESPTCRTYDSRGRTTQVDYPNLGSPYVGGARTVTYSYVVGGNPLKSTVADPAGTITVVVDLLGRPVSYTDVWGATTTTSYDQAGRTTATTTTIGASSTTRSQTYLADGSPDQTTIDGVVVADAAYQATTGRLDSISYSNGTALASLIGNGGYDTKGQLAKLTWTGPGGTLHTDQVTRDTAGRVVDQVIDGHDPTAAANSFAYDTAGRLTSAVIANRDPATGAPTGTNRTIGYGFGTADASCPTAPNAGKNTNRTRLTVDGVTQAIYCYDNADRLTSTTQAGYSSTIAYDSHGNTTTIAGETRGYDSADRHQSTTKAGTTVEYVRDATDRIVARKLNGTTTERYAHGGGGDSPSLVLDGSSNLVQKAWGLPGGVVLTRAATDSWSYPNIHGDVALVTNGTGAKQGPVRTYDPYGSPDTTLVDNLTGNMDWAWLGSHQRPLEHQTGLAPTLEMGARQYDPTLGRFLETDPVEMGSANDYDYCAGEPTGCTDLQGRSIDGFIRSHCGGLLLALGPLLGAVGRQYCDISATYADWAERQAAAWYSPRTGCDCHKTNAARHYLFAALLTYTFGVRVTTVILGFHELGGRGNACLRRDHLADQHNNYVGIGMGLTLRRRGFDVWLLLSTLDRLVRTGGLDLGGGTAYC